MDSRIILPGDAQPTRPWRLRRRAVVRSIPPRIRAKSVTESSIPAEPDALRGARRGHRILEGADLKSLVPDRPARHGQNRGS